MLIVVATPSSSTATNTLRAPARPSAPDAAIDPTLAISIETTSGRTVMRIRLTKIVLRPAGLEGLNAVVSWTSGASAGIRFETPLHPSVLDFLVKSHPDETRPISVEIGEKPDAA